MKNPDTSLLESTARRARWTHSTGHGHADLTVRASGRARVAVSALSGVDPLTATSTGPPTPANPRRCAEKTVDVYTGRLLGGCRRSSGAGLLDASVGAQLLVFATAATAPSARCCPAQCGSTSSPRHVPVLVMSHQCCRQKLRRGEPVEARIVTDATVFAPPRTGLRRHTRPDATVPPSELARSWGCCSQAARGATPPP